MKHPSLLPIAIAALTISTVGIANAQVIVYDFGTSSSALDLNPTTDTHADANGGAIVETGFTAANSPVGNPARSASVSLDQIGDSLNLADDFFSFTISKEGASSSYNLGQVSFDYQVGNHSNDVHDTTFYLFSSVGGFAAAGNAIASFVYNSSTADTSTDPFLNTGAINLGASFQNLTANTEFRIYLSDAGSNSGAVSARIDNITLNAIPEPSTVLLLGVSLGSLVLLRRYRRA